MKHMAGEKQFYQLYFQEPGKAEHELEADVRKTMLMWLYSASGDATPDKRRSSVTSAASLGIPHGSRPRNLTIGILGSLPARTPPSST